MSTYREFYTTAPADYDYGQLTEHVADVAPWKGKPIRCVRILADRAEEQIARYASGLHGAWEEHPAETDARWVRARERARLEEEARQRAEVEARRWVGELSDDELEEFASGDLDDELDRRGVTYTMLRDERRKREAAATAHARAAHFAECRDLVPDGVALVDDGETFRDAFGATRHRPPIVYYDVDVEDYSADAETCKVYTRHGRGRDLLGDLDSVAAHVRSGRLRVVPLEDLPPRKVLERVGLDRLEHVKGPLTIEGRSVWVGWPAGGFREPLVLDAAGHKVRKKSVVKAAIQEAR